MNHNIFLAWLFIAAFGFAGPAPVPVGGMNEDMREIRGLAQAIYAHATGREFGELSAIPDNYSILQPLFCVQEGDPDTPFLINYHPQIPVRCQQ